MAIVYRIGNGGPLSYAQADENWRWLTTNMSGSIIALTGSVRIDGSASGSFSGSFQGDGSKLTGISVGSISGVVKTGLGDASIQTVEGGLVLTGDLTAEQYIISSSVVHYTESFAEGSTRFGDSLDDTHQMTGSVLITGSTDIIGPMTQGSGATATGVSAFSQGTDTIASNTDAHAEGQATLASGPNSHAEGYNSTASGTTSHAEGGTTWASNTNAHSEGTGTVASGMASHTEGIYSKTTQLASHAEGAYTLASNIGSHAEGSYATASGLYSHAEGKNTNATADFSHTEGASTLTTKDGAHAEGSGSMAKGYYAHAEGKATLASQSYAHSEGYHTSASAEYSHAEGYNTKALGYSSHTEGVNTIAIGSYSHAEGQYTSASAAYSHAEGYFTNASAPRSHAEGVKTVSNGTGSHAEGYYTSASGDYSHVGGSGTETAASYQTAIGQWNQTDSTSTVGGSATYPQLLFQIGAGVGSAADRRLNAFTAGQEFAQGGGISGSYPWIQIPYQWVSSATGRNPYSSVPGGAVMTNAPVGATFWDNSNDKLMIHKGSNTWVGTKMETSPVNLKKYSATSINIPAHPGTIQITHNLGTQSVIIEVYNTLWAKIEDNNITVTSDNTTQITIGATPTSGFSDADAKVVVIG